MRAILKNCVASRSSSAPTIDLRSHCDRRHVRRSLLGSSLNQVFGSFKPGAKPKKDSQHPLWPCTDRGARFFTRQSGGGARKHSLRYVRQKGLDKSWPKTLWLERKVSDRTQAAKSANTASRMESARSLLSPAEYSLTQGSRRTSRLSPKA